MSLIVPVESQVFLGIIINYIIKCNCSKTLLKSFCFNLFNNFGSTQHSVAYILHYVVFIFHNMSVVFVSLIFCCLFETLLPSLLYVYSFIS